MIDFVFAIIKAVISWWPLFVIVALVYVLRYLPFVLKYRKSNYKNESGIGLLKFLLDVGYTGEGLTFMELEKLPFYSKIMTNLYIPTEDGTTEIDVLYICPFGIYVIESKNYSGWIFGSQNSKNWTSVIYKTKNKFMNPIWQNKKHIKYLSQIIIGAELKSLIVFSERCELKKLSLNNSVVIKRNNLKQTIIKDSDNTIYCNEQIDNFYYTLKQYGNKTFEEKQKHIDIINQKME